MSKREELLVSIADRVKDYRAGEIAQPTPGHVDRWAKQFHTNVQFPLLSGLNHLLSTTYFSRDWVAGFLEKVATSEKFAGSDPCPFWRGANLLDIQQNGSSQKDMLELLDRSLKKRCGLERQKDCGSEDGPYVYLDDVLFSGSRVGNDLSKWLNDEAPAKSTVHILLIGLHTLGEWQADGRLQKEAAAAGKKIELHWWRAVSFENRKANRDTSEVLWPAALPEDATLKAYMAEETKFPFEPRKPGGKLDHDIFESEASRQLLEGELLMAGLKIRSWSKKPSRALRPLGFSAFGLGFGSVIVTFRNCPNNCPLALWWGDPEASSSSPLSKWYPLFPRKTYTTATDSHEFFV